MASTVVNVREKARRANELLGSIGTKRRRRLQQEARLNERVKALQERYGPEIEELKQSEQRDIDELVELVVPHFLLLAVKGTKTIRLRSGEISLRLSPEALEVTDETAVMRGLRRKGKLLKYTRLGKRTLDKNALKKEPELVASLRGVAIVRSSSVVIKPTKVQGEIVLASNTLSVQIPEDVED